MPLQRAAARRVRTRRDAWTVKRRKRRAPSASAPLRRETRLVWPPAHGYAARMKVQEIHKLVVREPFRPFAIRLNNGAKYNFKTARDLGAAKDGHLLFYFADSGDVVLIDAESIVEVFAR